jgi:hypothetical protein
MATQTQTEPDINNLNLMDEVVEVDQNADSEEFFNPPLPDDGEHAVVFALGNRGVKADRQWEGKGKDRKRTGAGFLNVHLQLKQLKDSGEAGGTIAFDNLSTVVMDTNTGRTSRVHAAFDLAGMKLTQTSLGGLKSEIERAITQSPKAKVVTRWEAQVNVGTKDSPDYQTVVTGQKNFPKLYDLNGNETGKYNPEVLDPKSGQTVRAQARVIKYGRL